MLHVMATPKKPSKPLTPLAQKRLALQDSPSQGWVADQIADKIGEEIAQQAISYWENGTVNLRNVHPRKLAAYAEVLGVIDTPTPKGVGFSLQQP